MTNATKLTKKSGASGKKGKDDDLDEAATFKAGQDGSLDRNNGFDPDPMATQDRELDEEMAKEEEKLKLEESTKKKRSDT